MQRRVDNVHYLIGEVIKHPSHSSLGDIVGVDQSQADFAILVKWRASHKVQRIELSQQSLEGLVESCLRRLKNKNSDESHVEQADNVHHSQRA